MGCIKHMDRFAACAAIRRLGDKPVGTSAMMAECGTGHSTLRAVRDAEDEVSFVLSSPDGRKYVYRSAFDWNDGNVYRLVESVLRFVGTASGCREEYVVGNEPALCVL